MNAEQLLAHYDRVADAPDAIARLRRFVLDLAVRGKLVEQDPDDEPASELLKRIAVEKARLVKAGEIRKPRHLANDGDLAPVFEIPGSWCWCRLDSIGAIIGGGTPSAADPGNFTKPGEGIPWLTPADLGSHNELCIMRGSRDLSEKGLQSSSATLMPVGTVLFTSRAPIGYVAIAANLIATNQGFKSIVPYVTDCSRFLALGMQAFAPDIDASASGTTFKEVSGKIIAGITFPLPPLAEQHRIVAKVDELMALCDRLEEARSAREDTRERLTKASYARLGAPDADDVSFRSHARFTVDALPALTACANQVKQLRQTILNLAVRGKLVEQDPADEPASELLKRINSWRLNSVRSKEIRSPRKELQAIREEDKPYTLPNRWEWARLGQIIYIKSGDGLIAAKMVEGPIPVFGGNGVTGFHNRPNVFKPTIVIGRVGYYCGSIHVTPDNAWVTDNAFVTVYCDEAIDLNFLVLLLKGTGLKERENATAQPVISGSKIYPLIVGLPPMVEQHRIVAKVDELMAVCDQLETNLRTTDVSRQRLLESLIHETLAPESEREMEAAE